MHLAIIGVLLGLYLYKSIQLARLKKDYLEAKSFLEVYEAIEESRKTEEKLNKLRNLH